MEMLEIVKNVKIPGVDVDKLSEYVNIGPKSIQFTSVVSYLSKELQTLCNLESYVNSITDPEDSSTFLVEVSSFLKEMACPYQCLMEGPLSQRLVPIENRIFLLYFLSTELLAARMISSRKEAPQGMIVEMQESDTAKFMREMLMSLGLSKPPPNITPILLFTKVEAKLKDLMSKNPKLEIPEPLFTGTLTEKQWFAVEKLQAELFQEYVNRRTMLLVRLDVTIQSFNWSERLKNYDNKIAQVYDLRRKELSVNPSVDISDILAARKDLVIVEKTSSASVRKNTKSSVNKVLIGSVPDRGGRPEEQQPPPPEVPSWQKNEPPKSNFSGGGGRNDRQQQSGGYNDQRNTSNYSNSNQGRNTSQFNNYEQQGKRYDYNNTNTQTEYRSQPSNFGGYGYTNSNQSDYRQHPQGGVVYQPQGGMMYQQTDATFGLGFGGYGATGGNFQQYGGAGMVQPEQDTYRSRGGGGRGRGPRGGGRGGGGGRRGGRGGGGDYYGGGRQY